MDSKDKELRAKFDFVKFALWLAQMTGVFFCMLVLIQNCYFFELLPFCPHPLHLMAYKYPCRCGCGPTDLAEL